MKNSDIIKYIERPGLLKSENIEQLKQLVIKYPFYQTAHVLLLKCIKNNHPSDFNDQLQKSSIYISDRDLLFRFLNQDDDNQLAEKVEDLVEKGEPVEKTITEQPKVDESKLLKNKNVRRKINDSFEGMGENISETILSQLEFSTLKEEDKLEYTSEIYFVEEERTGKNNFITIEAEPDLTKNKKKDILQIDETEDLYDEQNQKIETDEELFELIESEPETDQEKSIKNEYFDINHYADEEQLTNNDDLISKFIQNNPRLEPKEVKDEVVDISQNSVKEDHELLTETLAKVYIKQGLFEKAIQSYQKLCLKYPEKSTYFASQIKILEEKINKQ